jgi:hypothetical protein
VSSQATGEHGDVEHQRRVGEDKLAQIDDHVGLGVDRADKSLTTRPLGGAILVAFTAESRGLVIEVDDPRNLPESDPTLQGRQRHFIH